MAPTEVLARQHYEWLSQITGGTRTAISMLYCSTGSNTARAKKRNLPADCFRRGSDHYCGTHALIQEKVEYHDLALVVTDEQHRFGVKQREALTTRGNPPNILVMSATPIPRTLADHPIRRSWIFPSSMNLPAKRLPIKNCVVDTSYRPKAYAFIRTSGTGRTSGIYHLSQWWKRAKRLEAENVT